MSDDVKPIVYADPRVSHVTDELERYAVSIVPVREGQPGTGSGLGSGTCVFIGGRYFIATAGHVIDEYPKTSYFILSPRKTRDVYKVTAGGFRDDRGLDGWLELPSAAAKELQRTWLDVHRLRPYCDGAQENLVVFGSPFDDRVNGRSEDGLPSFTAVACWWATKALFDPSEIDVTPDRESRIYLDWPSSIVGHDGVPYTLPNAPGLSGGGIWALNLDREDWRAEHAQLVGIQYSWVRTARRRHLRAFQIHEWLKLLRKDLPELAEHIDPLLSAVLLPRPEKT